MTTTIPNLPTDSLYKFLAIAGVALIAIGILGPEHDFKEAAPRFHERERTFALLEFDQGTLEARLRETDAEMVIASKKCDEAIASAKAKLPFLIGAAAQGERDISALRELKDRAIRASQLVTQVPITATPEQVRKSEDDAATALQAVEELSRVVGKELARSRSATLVSEKDLDNAATEYRSAFQLFLSEMGRVKSSHEDLHRKVIEANMLQKECEELAGFLHWWQAAYRVLLSVGLVLAAGGFGLWYFKVQRLHDLILARQAFAVRPDDTLRIYP